MSERYSNSHGIALTIAVPLAIGLGSLLTTIYAVSESSLSLLIAYLLFGSVGLAMIWRRGGTAVRIYLIVYCSAAVAAIILVWIYTSAYGVPYWNGGSDELMYEGDGIEFGKNYGPFDYGDIRRKIVPTSHNSVGYTYLVGLLVKFSDWFDGFHTMVPRLFNAACLALLSIQIYQIGLQLRLLKGTAVAAALFTGCLPLMMWTSVQTLRDILQSLLLVSMVFLWLPDQRGKWLYPIPVMLFISALLLLPIWEMRQGQAFVALFIIASAIMLNRRSFKPVNLAFSTLPIFFSGLFFASKVYDQLSKDVLMLIDGIESYTIMRGADGTGGGLSSIVFDTSLFPIGWLYRTIYALVSPLPIKFFPIYEAWISFGTVVHLLFLPFLWLGLKRAVSYPAWRLIFLSFVLLFIGMAMFTFTIRHITQYLPFAVLLTALGYEKFQGNVQKLWLLMMFLGAGLGVIYIFFKFF